MLKRKVISHNIEQHHTRTGYFDSWAVAFLSQQGTFGWKEHRINRFEHQT